MEVSGQLHASAALPLEAGWAPELVWTQEKNRGLPGIEPGPSSPSLYRLVLLMFEVMVTKHCKPWLYVKVKLSL
jgi:hypothetical protein